ncbi:MAG: PAS domain S-box protein [Candidatus Cloacimonetes bacterium]|nr:PAS domain S-box protein [Candidatus Cloacimonadota bacterium]MCF7814286.1 PAS domain S-box protein [Candidatus Cloacimonadota bacterium]MCF7868885.1 PAS domain S-box protein [Candidatus Cloacimonadota bacterium]MCF7884327.1 PAS domain S-box protein [Candidatus Cloacimonadota bacterium]
MSKKLKIVLLEDYTPDAKLNLMYLKQNQFDIQHWIVNNERDFKKVLKEVDADLILSDFSLPQYDGFKALDFVKKNYPDLPFIMVTGSLDEETAADCIKQGAWDYVIKEHLVRLAPAVKNALARRKEIEQKKKAEKARIESEIKFEQFAKMLPEVVCEVDLQGNLKYVNEKAYEVFKYSEKDFKKGMNIFDFICAEDKERARENVQKLIEDNLHGSDEYKVIRKDGTTFTALIHANLVLENSQPKGFRAILVDISVQKENEKIIRQRENELKMMIDNSPIGVCSTNLKGNFISVNEKYCDMLGYTAEELLGMHFNEITHPEDREANLELFANLIRRKIDFFDLEKRYVTKDGKVIYCRIRSHLVFDANFYPLFETAVVEDITEQKRALDELKEREEFNYALFQHSPIETIVVDNEGRVVQSNIAVRENRSRMPKIGNIMYKDFGADHSVDMYEILMNCIETGKPHSIPETQYREKYWSIKIAPFKSGAIITAIDISPIKLAEQNLLKSLNEKEVLLKEVHHRVKNNMQIISSMLKLQVRHTRNAEAIDIIKESHNRVRSMSMIHEKLYHTADFEAVNFGQYLITLTEYIFSTYKIDKSNIKYSAEVKDVEMNINQAIPCGLIMNELITNCIKHAFPDGAKGKIKLSLKKTANHKTSITIIDNGIGLPEEVEKENPNTLGLQLVNALIAQINAEMKITMKNGTKILIEF